MTDQPDAQRDVGTQLAQERTDLAVMRTRLALERTLDAWVRTALSMISFGFTIAKFLQQMQEKVPGPVERPHAGRNIGLALAIMGTLGMVLAIYQHVRAYHELGLSPLRRPVSASLIVAFLIVLLGFFVFLGIAVEAGPF